MIKNMKRAFLFFSVILAASLVLTGCSGPSGNPSKGQPSASGAVRRPNRPDFGQPDRPADIRGIVKSLTGNEATILKVDLPNRQASSTPRTGTDSTTSKDAFSLGAAGRSGRMMAGGPGGPEGPGGRGGQDDSSREQMLAKLKEMSTGEEKIIIPVGIKMMKPSASTGAGKREMIEATLADITADKSLMIWLNTKVGTSTDNKKIADFVLINN